MKNQRGKVENRLQLLTKMPEKKGGETREKRETRSGGRERQTQGGEQQYGEGGLRACCNSGLHLEGKGRGKREIKRERERERWERDER